MAIGWAYKVINTSLNLALDVLDGVWRLHIEGEGLAAVPGRDRDLHGVVRRAQDGDDDGDDDDDDEADDGGEVIHLDEVRSFRT